MRLFAASGVIKRHVVERCNSPNSVRQDCPRFVASFHITIRASVPGSFLKRKRLAEIESQLFEATRLSALVRDDSLQQQLHFAIRDLNEAVSLLNHPHIEQRPMIIRTADIIMHLAATRLRLVNHTFDTFGPNASLTD